MEFHNDKTYDKYKIFIKFYGAGVWGQYGTTTSKMVKDTLLASISELEDIEEYLVIGYSEGPNYDEACDMKSFVKRKTR